MKIFYMNGEFVPENEATIPIWDRQFTVGDAVFDVPMAIDGQLFTLDARIDRLYRSANAVDIEIPLTKNELKQATIETFRRSRVKDAIGRIYVSRGTSVTQQIMEGPIVRIVHKDYGMQFSKEGIRVITSSVRSYPPSTLDPRIKSCSRLHLMLARKEAHRKGVDDAIFLNAEGLVTEATLSNVFIYSDGVLCTAPNTEVLEGITRQLINTELSREIGIPVVEKNITPYDLYNAEEVFETGTSYGVSPILEIDGRKVGTGKPGSVAMGLYELYWKLVRSGRDSINID